MSKKTSTINLTISTDENKIPEKIKWSAEDGGITDAEAKAAFLSIWDHEAKESLRIDLWTKDMPLDDMRMFFYQTLMTMSDTYFKATQDDKMMGDMKDFCDYFAEKFGLGPYAK